MLYLPFSLFKGLYGVRGPAAPAPAQVPGPDPALSPLPLGGARAFVGRHRNGPQPRREGRAEEHGLQGGDSIENFWLEFHLEKRIEIPFQL